MCNSQPSISIWIYNRHLEMNLSKIELLTSHTNSISTFLHLRHWQLHSPIQANDISFAFSSFCLTSVSTTHPIGCTSKYIPEVNCCLPSVFANHIGKIGKITITSPLHYCINFEDVPSFLEAYSQYHNQSLYVTCKTLWDLYLLLPL